MWNETVLCMIVSLGGWFLAIKELSVKSCKPE
nr:MAG TPA: hypothetical protein [Caudoviricetes sp.]